MQVPERNMCDYTVGDVHHCRCNTTCYSDSNGKRAGTTMGELIYKPKPHKAHELSGDAVNGVPKTVLNKCRWGCKKMARYHTMCCSYNLPVTSSSESITNPFRYVLFNMLYIEKTDDYLNNE